MVFSGSIELRLQAIGINIASLHRMFVRMDWVHITVDVIRSDGDVSTADREHWSVRISPVPGPQPMHEHVASWRTCVRHVVAGARSSFFRTEAGKIFASGGNELHQLGGTWPDTFQIVPMALHDVVLPIAQLSSAGSHTVFLSAECSNTDGGPCSTAGTEECINVETEATAPAFSFGCKCKPGWANGMCAENFISEYVGQCNVTLEGRCDVDIDECASSPCQRGICDDTVSCAAKLADDERTTSCAYGDRDCEDAEAESQKEREANNCGFELGPNQFMCTCEDNGLLGSYTSSEIARDPVGTESPDDIPTAPPSPSGRLAAGIRCACVTVSCRDKSDAKVGKPYSTNEPLNR
jgi:hypothetical protein